MKKDLFEEEKTDKESEGPSKSEESELIVEDVDDTASEDGIAEEFTGEDEEEASLSEDEVEKISSDESAEKASDNEAWIPLDDEDLLISPQGESGKEPVGLEEDEERMEEEDLEEDQEDILSEYIDEEEFADVEDEEAEVPPWDEGVEIPDHGEVSSPKKKRIFLAVGLLFLVSVVVVSLYVILKNKRIFDKLPFVTEEQKPSYVTRKLDKEPIKVETAVMESGKKSVPDYTAVKGNTAPTIGGKPATGVREGEFYYFVPKVSDADLDDKLTFFIANQPFWTKFNTITGELTGTPRSNDVGIYEDIVILVSDGAATASLPEFDISVTSVDQEIPQEKKEEIQQAKAEVEKKTDAGKKVEIEEKLVVEEKVKAGEKVDVVVKTEKERVVEEMPELAIEEIQKVEVGRYTLPDLTDLIKKSEFEDAAIIYHKEVGKYPESYSLKLEVVCLDKSVQLAFEQANFDRRMFILPKQIKEKFCFVVLWGLFHTKQEAFKALSTIPEFFQKQPTKPELVLIKQYL